MHISIARIAAAGRLGSRPRGSLRVVLIMVALGMAAGAQPLFAAGLNGLVDKQEPKATATAQPSNQIQDQLRLLIDTGALPESRWRNFGDYQNQMRTFYDAGGYSLVWTKDGEPTPQAAAIILQFKEAQLKGLNPQDYDAASWDGRLQKLGATAPASDLAGFDLMLTFCAMRYISDLHVGRVNPQHFKFGLDIGPYSYDLSQVLRGEVIQASDLNKVIQSFEPPYAGYQRTEAALGDYLKLAAQGDGLSLPIPAKSVRPGDMYAGMTQLLWRLRQLGDLPPANGATATPPTTLGAPAIYDDVTVEGVKHFQNRHGLDPDGILGRETITELNRPLSFRVWQLDMTLERYRWIPPRFPQPPIVVNIPEFRLRTLRRQPAGFLSMRVVVGKAYHHKTPVFAQNMRYVIFRPYWLVPSSIQRAELVPKIQRDPNYVAENNYEVVNNDGQIVTDGAISDGVMQGLRSGALRIRQKPGPKNALGLVKFIFPNSYNVYLHSTPAPQLFAESRRDFSHGCIRVQEPAALAVWVLRDIPGWTLDKVQAAMNDATRNNLQVNLPKPIPVLILYSTAEVVPDGEVRFFPDIYGYDAELERVLEAGYPYPS
ncbi:MAG TPA: L,D-transpeptidase family protein [Candidatus Binataceae bacterium]|nr:L,D-transpeptidase family protein [Candidatus Binataceae bacterium]